MAVTKQLTSAVPSISGGKVVEWEVGMTYTNGVSGEAQYYVSEFTTVVDSDDETIGFGLSAESAWNTRAQLLELCPISNWDDVFASQVESVFNPPVQPVPDTSYVIPDED
tara:strand:+ start:254 stop:583 length:330 start_codon:yes stop_codon:yes gene_type:complete